MNTQTQDVPDEATAIIRGEPQWAEVQSNSIPVEELEAWRGEFQEDSTPSIFSLIWEKGFGRYAGR